MVPRGSDWNAVLAAHPARNHRHPSTRLAKSILQLRRVRGRYYDSLQSDMPYGIYATGRLGYQAEAETT